MIRESATLKAVLAAFAVVLLIWSATAPANAAPTPAEAFVQELTDDGIQILQNKTLSVAQRRQKIIDLLNAVVDTNRIALFTLGQWRRTASKDDLDSFIAAFHEFTLASYGARLTGTGYSGESLKITGSVARADNDFIVSAKLIDPKDPSDNSSTADFRVMNAGGKFSVVDFSLLGIWFGVAQRDDFLSYLGKNNGNIAALTARLKQSTEKLRTQ